MGSLQNGTLWVDATVSNYTPQGNEFVDFGDGSNRNALGYTTALNSRHDYHSAGTFTVRLLSASGTTLASATLVVNASTPTATIDQNSLTTTSATPLLRGQWTGVGPSQILVTNSQGSAVYAASTGDASFQSLLSMAACLTYPNCSSAGGWWAQMPAVPAGVYTVKLTSTSGATLTTGSLTVNANFATNFSFDKTNNPYPNTPIRVSGSVGGSVSSASVFLVGSKQTATSVALAYAGRTDMNSVLAAQDDTNNYTARSGGAQIEGLANGGLYNVWSILFSGVPEGWYTVLVYDQSRTLLGTTVIYVTAKG